MEPENPYEIPVEISLDGPTFLRMARAGNLPEKALLYNAELRGEDLGGLNLEETILQHVVLEDCDFSGARMKDAVWGEVKATNVRFDKADLSNMTRRG